MTTAMEPLTAAPMMTPEAPQTPAFALSDEIAARLEKDAIDGRGAHAKNTERAMRADSRIWADWCLQEGVCALPAPPENIAKFIDKMGAEKAPATVARYVSTISAMHKAAGLPSPASARPVMLALKRLRREKGVAQKQAAPLRAVHIRPLIAAAKESAAPQKGKPDSPAARRRAFMAARDAALIALAYASAMRRSELVALDWADFDLTGDEYGFGAVIIRRSKSDQEGRGQSRGLPPDVMRLLKAWREAAPASEGPAFVSPQGARLAPYDVARIIQRRADGAGMDGAAFSGHSTRRGVTMDMIEAGQTTEQIKQITGHKSDVMIARYGAGINARKSARDAFAKIGKIAD